MRIVRSRVGFMMTMPEFNLCLKMRLPLKKATRLISDLSGKLDPQSQNQLVRWIMNKEKHAQNIISTICDYFLTQRVKPDHKDYTERLKRHHAVIIAAMKAKQHSDIKYAIDLKESIEVLYSYYPADK